MFRTIIRCVSIQPFTSTKNVVDCPSSSMTFGSLADTFMFFGVAFYQSKRSIYGGTLVSLDLSITYLNYLSALSCLFPLGVVLSMILRKLQSRKLASLLNLRK